MTNALLTRFSAAARDDDARGRFWPVPETARGRKLSSAFLRLIARMNLRSADVGEPRDGVGFRQGLCRSRCYIASAAQHVCELCCLSLIPIARRQKQVSFVAAPELVAVGQLGKGSRALTVSLLQECGLGMVC